MVRLHSYGNHVSFYHLDQHAKKIKPENINSIADIVDYLKRGVVENTPDRDIYLARGFLVWMSLAYEDKTRFKFERYEELIDFPVSFFELFFRSANIKCEVIRGKAKTKEYDVGDRNVDGTHYWLAFQVEDQWHLIDPGWCLIRIVGHSHGGEILLERHGRKTLEESTPQEGREIQIFDDLMYCTNPDVFLFSHFPDDPKWQLRQDSKPPITFDEWVNLPFFKRKYFNLNLVLLSKESSKLTSNNGRCTIQIMTEETIAEHLQYSNKLYISKEDAPLEMNEHELPLLVLQGRDANIISFEVRLPVVGKYRIDLLFGLASEKLDHCCEFSIRCDTADPNCRKLPIIPAQGFGYSREAEEAGLLKPSVSGPKIFFKSSGSSICKEDMIPKVFFRIDNDALVMTEYGAFRNSGGEDIYYEPKLDQLRRLLDVTPNILTDEFEFAIIVAKRPRNTLVPFAPLLYYIVTKEDDTEHEKIVEDANIRQRELRLDEKNAMKINKRAELQKRKDELTASINNIRIMTQESESEIDLDKVSNFHASPDWLASDTELNTEMTDESLQTNPISFDVSEDDGNSDSKWEAINSFFKTNFNRPQ